jgi:hypothetical protein
VKRPRNPKREKGLAIGSLFLKKLKSSKKAENGMRVLLPSCSKTKIEENTENINSGRFGENTPNFFISFSISFFSDG